MFNFAQFFDNRYLFDSLPQTDFLLGFPLLIFFGLVLFSTVLFKQYSKDNKYLRKSVKKKLWKFPYLGAIGLVLVLARFGEVPVFSMRALLYGFVLFVLVVLILTVLKAKSEYAMRMQSVRDNKKY